MRLAGLDVATRTGFACMEGDKLIHAEAFRPRGKSNPEIFHGFREWLRPMLIAHEVEHVAIEEPLRSDLRRRNEDGTDTAITQMATYLRLYGLYGHAIEICYALNIDCIAVNQSAWRKAFLGNGRADKSMAISQCKQLGFGTLPADAAEAIGVAWWLSGHLRLTRLMRPGELKLEGAAA